MTVYRAGNIRQWTEKAKRNTELVVKQSIQDLSRLAQTPKAKGGRMPVKEGFLRNSYVAGLNGSTTLAGPVAYQAVVATMEMGQVFSAGWTAPYAQRMEKGFIGTDKLGRTYNQPGNFFMQSALQQWATIVEANARAVE